jgi:hypothetical protein
MCDLNLSSHAGLFFETWSHARQNSTARDASWQARLAIRCRQAQNGRHKRQTEKVQLSYHPSTRDTLYINDSGTLDMEYDRSLLLHTCPLEQVNSLPWSYMLVNAKHSANDACRVGTLYCRHKRRSTTDAYSFRRPRNNVDLCLMLLLFKNA